MKYATDNSLNLPAKRFTCFSATHFVRYSCISRNHFAVSNKVTVDSRLRCRYTTYNEYCYG